MKRKGFTLVELLAVIVILAIIALITTVVVINIIETVKIRKYKVEEKSLEKAAELYYTNSQIFLFQDEISLNTLVEKGFINSVKDTGNGSTCEGKVIKDNNGKLKGCLKCSNYVTEGCGYVIEQEIKDENPGVICGSGKNEDYDKQEECHIKSVEDLVAFSYLVNSGKTFEGKTVYLDKDLDITNYAKEKSYVDPDKKALYDINGDREITSLKDEMTTDKGFQPIGTNEKEKNFKGKFEGNAYTISNLMINRPNEVNVGLFGYVSGENSNNPTTIVGLNIKNINVKGNSNVGGVAGYLFTNAKINEIAIDGNIEATGSQVGGLVGNCFSYGAVQGIVESGTIKGENNVYGSGNKISTAYVNSKKVNLIKNLEEETDNYVGIVYEDSPTGNINLYDKYLDTWLGGDNDGSGYYFDYESETSNKIVLRSNQIDITFKKGSGTQEDPYLIYSKSDMKKIAAMPKVQNYYKLMSDIDYNNEHYYMIGTRNEEYNNKSYYFTGIIDGNLHTIKNLELKGHSNVGLIGYANSAVVQGLNVENATIIGNNNVGLFGYVSGENSNNPTTIVGLNIKNINVKGNSNVGGVAGYLFTNAKINEIAIDGNIEATGSQVGGLVGYVYANSIYVTSVISNTNVTGYDNVGGLVGNCFSYGAVQGIVESGTIKGENNVYGSGNKISNAYVSNAYVNEKVVITSTGSSSGIGGTEFSESYYNNLHYYGNLKLNSNVVVETPYSGDIDASGYYFNFNNDGTDIIVVKANNLSQSLTTGSVVYTKTVTEGDDKEAPTCTLGRYSVHGNGFTASYTCTDNIKVKARKHIYWVAEPSKVNYEDLISWPSTTDSSSETVSSVWTVESANNIGIEPPSKGSCYYFYYGAQDEAGNTVIYATPNCISY